jgi:hypothetical protein
MMRKTSMMAALVLSTIAAAAVGCDDDTDLLAIDDDEDFAATLTAAAEVPAPVGSPTATGIAAIVLEDRTLTVVVTVTGLLTSDVTMAHIHAPAPAGQTANIVLDFVPSMTAVINAGTRTGTIVSASFDLDALVVSSTGVLRVDPNQLVQWLNTGQAYVNVHTVNNPGGEIRGQIAVD